jgi:predicted nucleic acid-binding protein
MKVAIVDNAALVNFTWLKDHDIFDHLRLLFKRIHIPMEVKKEYEQMLKYESDRVWVLERLRPDEGFYSLCSSYDSLAVDLYKTIKGVDNGEAEAAAQQKKIGANYVLSDDKKFQKAIKFIDPTIKVISTLHVIALLDLNKFLPDPHILLKSLIQRHPFTASELREAYRDSAKELSVLLSKKEISQKCGIKRFKTRFK